MAVVQGLYTRLLEKALKEQGMTDWLRERKSNDNDNSEHHSENDDGQTQGSAHKNDDDEDSQKYAWIGVEVPKPSDHSGFNKKSICAAMGIDEETFHFIQVSDFVSS